MNLTTVINTVVLAVEQPTPEGGPFGDIASKFLGLLWAFTGWIGLAAFLSGAAVFFYQKVTMQQSSVTGWLGGVLLLIGCGALGAQIINWAMGT